MRDPRYTQLRLRIPTTHTFITATPPANDAAESACLRKRFGNMVMRCAAVVIVYCTAILAFILGGRGSHTRNLGAPVHKSLHYPCR